MTDLERKLSDLIYEVICDIESDFENKLTIQDIYKKLVKIRVIDKDEKIELECVFENLI